MLETASDLDRSLLPLYPQAEERTAVSESLVSLIRESLAEKLHGR
jgi:hypothetical protein